MMSNLQTISNSKPHFRGLRCYHPLQVSQFLGEKFEHQKPRDFTSAVQKYNDLRSRMSLTGITLESRADQVAEPMLDDFNVQMSTVISEACYQGELPSNLLVIKSAPNNFHVRGGTRIIIENDSPKALIRLRRYDILNHRYYSVSQVWGALFHELIHAKLLLRSDVHEYNRHLGNTGHEAPFLDLAMIFETYTRRRRLKFLYLDIDKPTALYTEMLASYPKNEARKRAQIAKYRIKDVDMQRAQRYYEEVRLLQDYLAKYKPETMEQLKYWAMHAKVTAFSRRALRAKKERNDLTRKRGNQLYMQRMLGSNQATLQEQTLESPPDRASRGQGRRWWQKLLSPKQAKLYHAMQAYKNLSNHRLLR